MLIFSASFVEEKINMVKLEECIRLIQRTLHALPGYLRQSKLQNNPPRRLRRHVEAVRRNQADTSGLQTSST